MGKALMLTCLGGVVPSSTSLSLIHHEALQNGNESSLVSQMENNRQRFFHGPPESSYSSCNFPSFQKLSFGGHSFSSANLCSAPLFRSDYYGTTMASVQKQTLVWDPPQLTNAVGEALRALTPQTGFNHCTEQYDVAQQNLDFLPPDEVYEELLALSQSLLTPQTGIDTCTNSSTFDTDFAPALAPSPFLVCRSTTGVDASSNSNEALPLPSPLVNQSSQSRWSSESIDAREIPQKRLPSTETILRRQPVEQLCQRISTSSVTQPHVPATAQTPESLNRFCNSASFRNRFHYETSFPTTKLSITPLHSNSDQSLMMEHQQQSTNALREAHQKLSPNSQQFSSPDLANCSALTFLSHPPYQRQSGFGLSESGQDENLYETLDTHTHPISQSPESLYHPPSSSHIQHPLQYQSHAQESNHCATVDLSKRHKCSTCGKSYNRPWKLQGHIDFEHKGIRHQCKSCPSKFKYPWDLKEHIRNKHENMGFECPACPKVILHSSSFRRHMKNQHPGYSYETNKCLQRLDS